MTCSQVVALEAGKSKMCHHIYPASGEGRELLQLLVGNRRTRRHVEKKQDTRGKRHDNPFSSLPFCPYQSDSLLE